MKTATLTLLGKVKDAHQLTSSYQAAKLLGLHTATIYNWINKKVTADDDTTRRMCELASEDPAYWLPLVASDRTKSPVLKQLWRSIAEKAARAAVVVLTAVLLSHPAPTPAQDAPQFAQPVMYYAHRLVRWLLRLGLVALVALGFLSTPARAADWTPADTRWQTAYSLVLAADWLQTRNVARRPDDFHELNPLLGRHPDVAEVNQFFLVSAVGNYLIARALPAAWRRRWHAVSLVYEVGLVAHNHHIGLTLHY